MTEHQSSDSKRAVLSLPINVGHNCNTPTIKLEMQFTDQLTPVHYRSNRLSVEHNVVSEPSSQPTPTGEAESTEPYVWYIPETTKPAKKTLLVPISADDIETISLLESRNINTRFAEGLSFRYYGICITSTNVVKASVPTSNRKKNKAKQFSFSKFENPLAEALSWQLSEGKSIWKSLWTAVCHGHLHSVRKENLGINVRPVTQGKAKKHVHCIVEWRDLEDKNKKCSAWFSVSECGSAQKAEERAIEKQKEEIEARKTHLEGLGSTVSLFAT